MKSLNLSNFIKSKTVMDLEPIKIDMYKLKKVSKITNPVAGQDTKVVQYILNYKIKKTKYRIYSCKLFFNRIPKKDWVFHKVEEGFIEIKKGFKKKKFYINHLPSAITVSINKNMDRFNQLVPKKALKNKKAQVSKKKTDKEKRDAFLNSLDT